MTFVAAAILFVGCNDDDDNFPTDNLQTAFEAQYPNATDVSWSKHGSWNVVDFRKNGKKMEAWYSSAPIWAMTVTDLSFSDLPAAVRNAFDTGEYRNYTVKNVEMVERRNYEPLYVVNADGGETNLDIYYLEDGSLLKTDKKNSTDNHENYLPVQYPTKVTQYLNTNYPNATIINEEKDGNYIDVLIADSPYQRTVRFDLSGNWVSTVTPLMDDQVPDAVMSALNDSEYADYPIVTIQYRQTEERNYYYFVLKGTAEDIILTISPDGTITV